MPRDFDTASSVRTFGPVTADIARDGSPRSLVALDASPLDNHGELV